MKRRTKMWLILGCSVLAIAAILFAYRAWYYSSLSAPAIALTFNPAGRTEFPQGEPARLVDRVPDTIYTYDLFWKRLTPVEISGLKWCDANMESGTVVGCAGDRVVKASLDGRVWDDLGPMEYDMTYIKCRPGTRDFSGLT